jgi:phospholipase C
MTTPTIGGVFSMLAVTIFEHANFEGRSRTLSVGEHRLLDFDTMKDMTSSIRVSKGLVALVYEHVDSGGGYGISADFLEDCADLSQFDLDDKISYISVFAAEQPSGLIWVRNSLVDGQFAAGHFERKSAGTQPPISPVAVVSPPIPPHQPPAGAITYAPRSHDQPTIELAAGEERLYRLPPVSKGSVIVKAFHADISLHASGSGEPAPLAVARADTQTPTPAEVGPGVVASDDPGGGGHHSDTSPARNLELELRLGNRTMASHGNLVQAESPNHTDGWRLRIRRLSPLNDLTPNPGQYRIETSYTSQLPILERRIPASFFHEGFEANWNRQQYIHVQLNSSKLFVSLHNDFRQLYNLEETYVQDTGLPLDSRDLHASSLTLDVGAGPSPRGGGTAPFFSVRADFPAGGKISGPAGSGIALSAFHIIARFYLCRRGDDLEYVPIVESDLLDVLGASNAAAKAKAKKTIEDGLYESQFPPHSGLSAFGRYLGPWLIGDRRQLWSIGYAPGATDTQRPDGVVESATGELLVTFVGPRPKPTEPVIADPDRPPAADDGSIRLYDLPDEEPDPPPDTGNPEPSGGGGAVPRPKIGALSKIDHIVVLMQENRSFDQVLGYLSRELGRTNVNGLNALPPDPNVNPQFNHFNNRNFFPQRAASTAWPFFTSEVEIGKRVTGPCHETDCVLSQMDDNMGRFVASFAGRAGANSSQLRLVMDYFGADQLPVYAVLAREFGICDKWYTSHAGPTIPNRFVLLTGDLNLDPFGNVEENNPDLSTMLPVQTATLFDHLNERGVSWRIFENGYSFIRLFRNFTFDTTNVLPFDNPVRGFEAAARAGDLPQVTLIEPDYIDLPPGNDDHPPADMKDGQKFVNRIVQALIAGPQWERTLLVITYDEHGGFYDHASPPTNAPPLRSNRRALGPRVPTFVVSPLVERGAVFKSRFDHTSIGATILRRFAGGLRPPPRISQRLDAALDLRETLTLAEPRPRSDFASLGLPPLELSARRSKARSTLAETSERIGPPDGKKEDFHWLLSGMRLVTGEAPR